MFKINNRQKAILAHYDLTATFTPQQALDQLGLGVSLVTIRRDIRSLVEIGFLKEAGAGPALHYYKTTLGMLLTPIDAHKYQEFDVDKRSQKINFNQELFPSFPKNIFSKDEIITLEKATAKYQEKTKGQTPTIYTKELERFVIELSWKSSKIEGNTYTLLDTEILLKEGLAAEGKTKLETDMILNHKKAFTFILEQNTETKIKPFVEKLHQILTENLSIDQGIRKSGVGITGTNYTPLEISFQIQEALDALYESINRSTFGYQKALLALLGISYIQPFADGNKRTARLLANYFLISKKLAPLSYRNVDEKYYREAILVFYEKNSLVPMKEIFIDQYLFSADNYALGVR